MIKHGNYKESETITFTTEISGVAISSKVAIGNYVNYDAGNWDATKDEAKIKSSGGTVTWNTTLPSLFSIVNGTFLGYLDKQSRNIINKPNVVTKGFIYVKENIDIIKEAESIVAEVVTEEDLAYANPRRGLKLNAKATQRQTTQARIREKEEQDSKSRA